LIAPFGEDAEAERHGAERKSGRPSFLSAFSRRSKPQEESQSQEAEELAEPSRGGRRFSLSGRLTVASLAAAAVLMLISLVQRPSSGPAAAPPTDPSTAAPSVGVAAATPQAQPPAPVASPARGTVQALFPAREKAFVTARILNCRASPVEQAGSVKKLSRGDEVAILAREADWMSISHDGRQCWAGVRYISLDRPA
jgi:hypothetical protein